MKKFILIGVILIIAIVIPVAVFALKDNSLYLPPDGPEEPTSTSYSKANSSDVSPYSTNELTEEEKEILQQTLQESEEYQKENEKAREILRKYNPDTFDELYEANVKYLEEQKVHGSEITDEQKKLYKMLIDTYENDNLNEDEKEMLKQQIEENYDYISSISGLQERADKILNE